MPLPKVSKSVIGLVLAKDIASFMDSNSKYLNKKGTTYEEGNKAIAEAIAYGISKALSDPKVIKNLELLSASDVPLPVTTAVAIGIPVLAPPPAGVGATTAPGIGTGVATSTHGTNVKSTFKTIFSLFKE